MEIKFKKLKEDALSPELRDNSDKILIKSRSLTQELDKSNRIVLVYHTGLSVQIPEGHIGLLFPIADAHKYSLDMCDGVSRIYPGDSGEITAKFKINTDSLPTVFQPQEDVLEMIVIPYATVDTISTEECNAKELSEEQKKLEEDLKTDNPE